MKTLNEETILVCDETNHIHSEIPTWQVKLLMDAGLKVSEVIHVYETFLRDRKIIT
jgi:hypothetical protein